MANNPYKPSGAPPGPPGHSHGGAKPENYLIQAILVTLCCCLPFGVVSIVYAAQVDSKWNQGDYAGANASAANAKKWFYIALILGILANIIVVGLQVALAANDPAFR